MLIFVFRLCVMIDRQRIRHERDTLRGELAEARVDISRAKTSLMVANEDSVRQAGRIDHLKAELVRRDRKLAQVNEEFSRDQQSTNEDLKHHREQLRVQTLHLAEQTRQVAYACAHASTRDLPHS